MVQIQDTIVSLDVITKEFCCDLKKCHGACCVEGDAGAPVTTDEIAQIEQLLPVIKDMLSADALKAIEEKGIAYPDPEGELVTQIVNGKDCVFTYYGDIEDWNTHLPIHNCCLCALEKAYRAGKTRFCKPISCALYPIREKRLGEGLVGLNYNRWAVCKMAIAKGIQEDLRLYQFSPTSPSPRRFSRMG